MRRQSWIHLLLFLDYLTQGKDTGLDYLIWTSCWVECKPCLAEKAFWKVTSRSQKGINANGQWTFGNDGFEAYGLSQIDIGEDRVAYGYSCQLCFPEGSFVKGSMSEISTAEVSMVEICVFDGGTIQVCTNQAGTGEDNLLHSDKHEISIVESSIAEIGMRKVGTGEVGTGEIGTTQVGIDKIGIFKVGTVKVSTTQVSTTKIGTTQVSIAEIDTTQVGVVKENTTQVVTTQVNATQIRTANLVFRIIKTVAFIIISLFSPSIPMLNTLSQLFELFFVCHGYLPFLSSLFLSINYPFCGFKKESNYE
ncbi:hypothetical protein Krac_7577 [Ktedonobacter racemifer DSM 44963]|uniref:Uncharacterized protein n=1 Tax=Ktedonobacter racemifer DSM 44963 TaxID=485913 RepID=D6TKI5_KTERA|nr:hypothetical protein Krac_7577 [Ktedonobacter racemifer DSM 44963]